MKSNHALMTLRSTILLIALALGTSSVYGGDFVPDEVIVRFMTPTTLSEAQQLLNGSDYEVITATYEPLDIYLVRIVNQSMSEQDAIDDLKLLSYIDKVHHHNIYEPHFYSI